MQHNDKHKLADDLMPSMPIEEKHERETPQKNGPEKSQFNQSINKQTRHIAMLWLGWFCIIISPIIGAIPGPGFIIIFPIGLALVLKNSRWAKGLYIKFKRKFPEYGHWTDWALRRKGQKEMPPLPPFKEQLKRFFGR